MLRFENVTKRFGGFVAVDDLSLDIHRGEFFALLGPSGCGKTTLLRLAAGFETPDQGRIILDCEDIGGRPPHQRPVNMMFQSYALFPHMTVARNIAFGLKQDGLPRDAIATQVADMLSLLQLEGLGDRKPDQLSGGQRQRVALARALVKRPKVLLLDEPLAALDKKLREQTQWQLAELQRRLSTTFVIVTHDQQEAMSLADRMAVMQHGRIAQLGAPAEIYEQPSSRDVAAFIGDVNLIEGRVALTGSGWTDVDCGPAGYVRVEQACKFAVQQQVWIALRPEKLRISRGKPSVVNTLRGTIEEVTYAGETSLYKIRAGGDLVKASAPNIERVSADGLRAGETAWLGWPADAAIILAR